MNEITFRAASSVSATVPRPRSVTLAFRALVAAVGFGVAETAVHSVGQFGQSTELGSLIAGWLIRTGIYVVVLVAAWRMLRGDRWARLMLALGIGVLGTASLLVEPLTALLAADGDLLPDTTVENALVAITRVGHICAVLIAIPAMYTPEARAWFT
ncbi:hypothetical protein [Nocardia flavorosea]|uniref:Uncharacterized protein n=1 Tax=Nocardia flavorosea TaxID=53429 RepID=A0A846YDS7_9NOCA|nr:hypothetical protein [Nocardia flavorosea]NKY56001.1 hypothetical protein [Nocardia flavorosea]